MIRQKSFVNPQTILPISIERILTQKLINRKRSYGKCSRTTREIDPPLKHVSLMSTIRTLCIGIN